MAKPVQPRLLPTAIFMTDENRHPDPHAILKNLAPGTGVIFRHYPVSDRAALAQKVADVCRQKKLLFLVAGDIELATAVGADGVHFPEWSFLKGKPLPPLNRDWVVTASAHNEEAIRRAEKIGANAILLAPVFSTPSHPERPILGVPGFVKLASITNLPVYALGGITMENFKELPSLKNLAGFAGISVFEK